MWALLVALLRHDRKPHPGQQHPVPKKTIIADVSVGFHPYVPVAHIKNAAVISEGRKEEPISTQPYLSTSPRKNEERLVPFSRMISARLKNRSSSSPACHPRHIEYSWFHERKRHSYDQWNPETGHCILIQLPALHLPPQTATDASLNCHDPPISQATPA